MKAGRLAALMRHFLPSSHGREDEVWQLDSELAQKPENTSGTFLPPHLLRRLTRSHRLLSPPDVQCNVSLASQPLFSSSLSLSP